MQTLLTLMALHISTPTYQPRSFADAVKRYGPLTSEYSWPRYRKWTEKLEVGLNQPLVANRDMVVPLLKVLLELTDRGLDKEIRVTWGCYSGREIAGTGRPSHHAYGLACDFDSVGKGTRWSKDFVEVWRKNGFCWGGDFQKTAKDYMHFSYGWECQGVPRREVY